MIPVRCGPQKLQRNTSSRICLFLPSLLRRFTLVSVRWLVITQHSRALTPTKHYAKDMCAHLPPYLAVEMIVTVHSPKVMPRHVNMHITIAGYVALLNFGFPHRLHASAFRLHAKRRSERASVSKGLLHESHQLFLQSQYRPICTTCGYCLACSLSKALWCAVRLAVHTFVWPIFPERGRLGSIAPWLLTDCSERRLHIITFGWFAGSERCSSCSQYWSVTYE